MLFAVECKDKPNSLDIRMATRASHLAFLEGLGDDLVLAGPFLDADEKPNGSLIIFKADDLVTAEATMARDPYGHAGLFESVIVRPWVWALNKPEDM